MGEVLEIVKALVSPTEKLIDAVQGAIGKAYEPRHIRKIADAKAYEIEKLGQTMRESSDIAITYDKGDITLDTADFDAFVKRTQNRLAYQELMKQKNIEAVIDVAYENFTDEQMVTAEPVDSDWVSRFFNDVEDISNEEMQNIWAKVLSGEIKQPRSVSLRTLDVLKNLGQNDAVDFKRIVPYILRAPGNKTKDVEDYFVLCELMEKYEFEYPFFERLNDAGLIFTNSGVVTCIHINSNEDEWVDNSGGRIRFFNNTDDSVTISCHAYVLTQAGKELYNVAFQDDITEPLDSYIVDNLNVFLNSVNRDVITAEIYKI